MPPALLGAIGAVAGVIFSASPILATILVNMALSGLEHEAHGRTWRARR